MILTVGGSPEPVVKSIEEHSPERVYFIASHASVPLIGTVVAGLKGRVEHQTVVVEDPEDLMEVYLKCARELKGIEGKDVLIDYTGGTKSMSAGVALYGVVHGCTFTYVGGTKRSKGGLGVVETGSERIVSQENPFDFFAIREKERGVYLFNRYQFEGAIREFESALAKVQDRKEKSLITAMKDVAEAYFAWDRFEISYNGVQVSKKLLNARSILENIANLTGEDYTGQIKGIEGNLRFFKEKKKGYNIYVIADVFLNAERRGDEGKYDDGVARLYRCMEMVAQYRLKTHFGIDTSNVNIEKLPTELGPKYKRLRDTDGKIRIGLKKGYELLQDLGDDLGRWYFDSESGRKIQELLGSRNNSILAHGLSPVGREVFEELVSETRAMIMIAFPDIEGVMEQGRFVKF